MKKLSVLLVSVIIVLLTSCQFSENIYIDENGTGKMSFQFDGSELMKMGGQLPGAEGQEIIDSTLVFKDFLVEKKDSIALLPEKNQENLKSLENYTMRLVTKSEDEIMNFELFTAFNNVSELENMLEVMGRVGNGISNDNKSASVNPMDDFSMGGGVEIKYSFKKNTFKRKAVIKDPELHKITIDSLATAEMFLEPSKYLLKYHFPRAVKSVSNDNALFSADQKTMSLEVPFMDYMKNPEILDIEVVLKKK